MGQAGGGDPKVLAAVRRWIGDDTRRVWCLHCERVWPAEHVRVTRRDSVWCPDPECDGGGPGDLWDYDAFRAENIDDPKWPLTHWPADPGPGQEVPLYLDHGDRSPAPKAEETPPPIVPEPLKRSWW